RWFNLGCAQSTLAKLYLTGHVQAADVAGFATTIPQRTTMLKMLSGDYCGGGQPFTVAGQALEWGDREGTMTITQPARVEAYWDERGAACLNTPRVVAHQTSLGNSTFAPLGVQAMIDLACPLPSCNAYRPPPTTFHLTSANAYPFSP
ncbi:MAG: ADYC domain-containing protein, partial [Kofleriaceae bacterium]